MEKFNYVVDETAKNVIMLLNGTVGGENGIDGSQFQRELLALDNMGKDSIEIMINSGGGSVMDGFSIASAILKCKTKVITNNAGIAGSIAAVIFMTAKNRVMSDYALLMVHNVSGGKNDKVREELNNSISLLLSKNSSLSQDQLKNLMDNETWMNYKDATINGFCTGIESTLYPNLTNVVFNANAYEEVFEYANNIINNINMKKEKSDVNVEEENLSITNEDVSADVVIINEAEVEEMEDKTNPFAVCTARVGREDKAKYEACVMAVKKEQGIHNEVEEEVVNEVVIDEATKFQNVINEKDVLIKKLEAEISRMKSAEQEKEINNFINHSIEIGKISNETKDSWINLCKSDFESTKEVIQLMTINREAPKFENNVNGEKAPKGFMEMFNFGKNSKK